jgi:hypothetical protein
MVHTHSVKHVLSTATWREDVRAAMHLVIAIRCVLRPRQTENSDHENKQ